MVSAPVRAFRSVSYESMSATTKWHNPVRTARARFSLHSFDRLSTTTTSTPRLTNASARCEPIKPAPPVITTRRGRFCGSRSGVVMGGCLNQHVSRGPFELLCIGDGGIRARARGGTTSVAGTLSLPPGCSASLRGFCALLVLATVERKNR